MISRLLIFIALLSCVALAAPAKNPIPEPELLFEGDSYSIAVLQMRENDEAVKALLEAALKSITSGETKLPDSMAEVSTYLSRNNRVDMLFAGLPFQAVRVDRMLPSGQTSPTYAATLAGWKGLQVNLYNSLASGANGKAYPSETYRRTELISREHAADPTWADTLCRCDGTFLFSPTPAQAKKTVDRLMPKDKATPVAGPLLTAYTAIPKTPAAYGILLNQKGAFSALLKSMNNEHIQKVREKVGSDRLERVVANTHSAVWQVNIVSAERADLQAILTLDAKNVAEAAKMFEDGKPSLDATKITDVTITPNGNTVTVKASIIGVKKLLLDGMAKNGK